MTQLASYFMVVKSSVLIQSKVNSLVVVAMSTQSTCTAMVVKLAAYIENSALWCYGGEAVCMYGGVSKYS